MLNGVLQLVTSSSLITALIWKVYVVFESRLEKRNNVEFFVVFSVLEYPFGDCARISSLLSVSLAVGLFHINKTLSAEAFPIKVAGITPNNIENV